MRGMLLVMVLVAGGCAGTARNCPTAPRPATPRPFLWEVSSANGTIYLYGTHHAAAGEDVPPEAMRLLASSELFVAEVPEVETYHDLSEGRRALELPPGHFLHEQMSQRDFDRLDWRLDIARSSLERMKPWVALGLLVKRAYAFPDPNMPTTLFEAARTQGKPMEYLDTLEQQQAFLDLVVDVHALTDTMRTPDLECTVASEVDRYLAGDESAFTNRGASSAASAPGTSTVKSSAITTREHVWSGKIASYAVSGKRVFIGIGVSNIVGPRGIAARLTEAGFGVKRL